MRYSRLALFLCFAGLSLVTEVAQATDEDTILGEIHSPTEQAMGLGRSAIWTLPLVATQYQPLNPTAAMQTALQAQSEARFLDALILLDNKGKQTNADAGAEMNLLRASFLLQGNQPRQALENLAPWLFNTRYAADAYALTAMAYLQLGKMSQALDAAHHAHDMKNDILPSLALSYVLQGMGRLEEARKEIHDFNARTPQSAIALAREAELALTLGQIQAAKRLAGQAYEMDAANSYVIAVNGLVYLIDGKSRQARAAFETALKRNPKDAKALFGLGLAEIKLENFEAGHDKLQAANEADPGNALILTYLGRSQQNLGQTEAAKASWRSAQQADPKDPIPWLYQAQAALQANQPLDARDSLREAQARVGYRSVYRGDRLLKEDEQLLQANLAEVQRQLGMEGMAFHTLSDTVGEKNSTNLRNQADLLQGQRFGESARRSLLLQSLFNEQPGSLPSELDIYGDNPWQAGSSSPQHGVVGLVNAQQASYNNYDSLFGQQVKLEADGITGTQSTNGEQVRVGVGSDILGLSLAERQFKSDGFGFDSLDNKLSQSIIQWRPTSTTQTFVVHSTFSSQHDEVLYPGSAILLNDAMTDRSQLTRVGLRHSFTDGGEIRGLLSSQTSDHLDNYTNIPSPWNLNNGVGNAHSEELQYRLSGPGYATQWGVQHTHGRQIASASTDFTRDTQQIYAAWQQELNPYWQLDAGLAWGKTDNQDNIKIPNDNSTHITHWLPKLGAVYTPDAVTHVHLAAWQGMGQLTLGDATLAPATLAGILLPQNGDDGLWIHSIALGADRQLSPSWLLDAKMQRRKTDTPDIDTNGPPSTAVQFFYWSQLDTSRLALHWQNPAYPFAVSFAYDYERNQHDPTTYYGNSSFAIDSVNEQVLRQQQLNLIWLASAHWSANLKWNHNLVYGTQNVYDPNPSSPTYFTQIFPVVPNSFNQLDADLSWKFNRSRGLLTVGVRNAFNKSFQYADPDLLNPRFSAGRLEYLSLKNAW
jgi:Tfp pilus assembly protein PilF